MVHRIRAQSNLKEFQKPLQERFPRPPFVKYSRGDDWGLVGFDKALTEEDVTFIKENVKTLNSKEVTWSSAEGW